VGAGTAPGGLETAALPALQAVAVPAGEMLPAGKEISRMMTVEVTQYMRPHGHKVLRHTDLSDDVAECYQKMRARGWSLAAEVIDSNEVVVWIEDLQAERDVDCRIAPNGPEVQQVLEAMLLENCR
jgi:hypothetical protein